MATITQLFKTVVPEPLWAVLKRLRRGFEVGTFRTREVTHNYFGNPLKVHLADPVGEGWYDHDWDAMPEFDLLQSGKLRPGAKVFDVGAHQCVVAIMLAKIVGDTGSVIAVEADQHSFRVGERNRELNGVRNLDILHAAVAERSGTITFTLDGHIHEPTRKSATVTVRAYTIDELTEIHGKPDVLFIDIEGYECKALEAASRTLEMLPDCFVEVHVKAGLENFGGSAEMVRRFFPPERYNLYVSTQEGYPFLPLEPTASCPENRFFLVALGRSKSS